MTRVSAGVKLFTLIRGKNKKKTSTDIYMNKHQRVKAKAQHFGRYACSLSGGILDEKINTTLIYVS